MVSSDNRKTRVMVVDDDEAILGSVKDYLQAFGYEVSTARDGRAALRRIMNKPPDVLLLDLIMPGMSGTELMVRLREMNLHLPIIIITGDLEAADKLQGQSQKGVLAKPFSFDKMRQLVEAFVPASFKTAD